MPQKDKGNILGKWLLFWLAPAIPFKYMLFMFYVRLCKMSYSLQIFSLRKAMIITGSKEEINNINEAKNLYLAFSETTNKELKLSGFFAENKEQFAKEFAAVPGTKYICMSMAELRENIIKNYMSRRFYAYQLDQLSKNGRYYLH
jgi:hypothetical protein